MPMPIDSIYQGPFSERHWIRPDYVKADLSPDCFKGAEHGNTIGIAHKVCNDVIQVWSPDNGWDLYFPKTEYERISKGRQSISMVQLQTILEEMKRQEQTDENKA